MKKQSTGIVSLLNKVMLLLSLIWVFVMQKEEVFLKVM